MTAPGDSPPGAPVELSSSQKLDIASTSPGRIAPDLSRPPRGYSTAVASRRADGASRAHAWQQ